MSDNAQRTNTGSAEIFIDELTASELIDRVDWKYEADGTWTVTVPKGNPLGDALHEYLSEVGEPLDE